MDEDPTITRTTTEARAGQTSGVVRWVLGISLTLVVVAMAIVILNHTTSGEPQARPTATSVP